MSQQIAILGTGSVGQAIADKLAALGHDVTIGTRDVAKTLAKTEPDTLWKSAHRYLAKSP